MVISVQFKNRDMEFGGKTYDFELAPNETTPEKGAIIRMTDTEGKKVCNFTRVKVVDIKKESNKTQGLIRYVASSMDEPSIAKK